MNRAIALLFMFTAACGVGRRSEPIIGPIVMHDAREEHGQRVFMEHCNQCHPGGDAGLGPAINNKPVPEAVMRLQVRQGLGAMPAIGPHLVDEKQLDDLIEYLEALRAAD